MPGKDESTVGSLHGLEGVEGGCWLGLFSVMSLTLPSATEFFLWLCEYHPFGYS